MSSSFSLLSPIQYVGSQSWQERSHYLLEIPKDLGHLCLDVAHTLIVTATKIGLVFLSILPAISLVFFYASLAQRDYAASIISVSYLLDSMFFWPRPQLGSNFLDLASVLVLSLPSELTYRTGKIATSTIGLFIPDAAKAIRRGISLEKLHIPFEKFTQHLDIQGNLRSHGIFNRTHLEFLEVPPSIQVDN